MEKNVDFDKIQKKSCEEIIRRFNEQLNWIKSQDIPEYIREKIIKSLQEYIQASGCYSYEE